ncbi:MAG: hypothetical protein U9N30_07730 [Campylobacterota bacterium]|nr:hypothetical protein [Campylobacterota bacterium]
MKNLNYIINTYNHDYDLNDKEIQSLKEVSILLERNYILYAFNELWNVFYSQMLRRIEHYGVECFLDTYPHKGTYHSHSEIVFERWESYNSTQLIEHMRSLKLIETSCYHLLHLLFYYKSKLENPVTKEYFLTLLTLLENTILSHPFVQSKKEQSTLLARRASDNQPKRRRSDEQQKHSFSTRKQEDRRASKKEVLPELSQDIHTGNINRFQLPLQHNTSSVEKYG